LFDWFTEYEYPLAATQLVLAMLGMGMLLAPRDFVEVVRRPRALAVGLCVQLVAVPLIAFGLGRLMPIHAGIAAGLVLVAAVPGGTMSNVITYLGRGNIALSIALTGVTTVGALLTTPAILRLFVGDFLPEGFEMPVGQIAWEIGANLLLPLTAGMLFGARFPEWRDKSSQWAIRGSIAVIVLMIVGSAGSGRVDAREIGGAGILSILLLAVACQGVAWLLCRGARVELADRTAVVVEATIRNVNLAVLVKASLFPAVAGRADPIGDGMFFTPLMYGGLAFLVATPQVIRARRRGATPA
jgi:BASS family bile acid:Na+ symporter